MRETTQEKSNVQPHCPACEALAAGCIESGPRRTAEVVHQQGAHNAHDIIVSVADTTRRRLVELRDNINEAIAALPDTTQDDRVLRAECKPGEWDPALADMLGPLSEVLGRDDTKSVRQAGLSLESLEDWLAMDNRYLPDPTASGSASAKERHRKHADTVLYANYWFGHLCGRKQADSADAAE